MPLLSSSVSRRRVIEFAPNPFLRHNTSRFPGFRFRLTPSERDEVVANCHHLRRLRFSPVLPWAFIEIGDPWDA